MSRRSAFTPSAGPERSARPSRARLLRAAGSELRQQHPPYWLGARCLLTGARQRCEQDSGFSAPLGTTQQVQRQGPVQAHGPLLDQIQLNQPMTLILHLSAGIHE